MADNLAVTPGTGATVAADDISGVLVQRVKVTWGVDGTMTDANASTPLPVAISSGGISSGTAGTPSTDVMTVQGITSMTALKVDGSAVTQPVSLSSVPSHAVTNAGTFAVQPNLTASANGLTSSRVNAAASTNATSLKASAGNIGAIDLFNVAAYDVFVKLYNKASAPTVGTDTPVWTIPIKAGTGYSCRFPRGKSFATGIAYAITKLQADSDTTVVVAGDVTGSIDWI